jgi:predicted enzyme related to lactoylglutathione lyase
MVERTSMLVKNIGLPWITVADMNKAKKLYIDTLGLKIHEENKEAGWLEVKVGNSVLGICQAQQYSSDKPGQNAVLTFTVDDIILAKKTLKQKNVQFVGEIMELPGVFKVASFH